MIRVPTGRDPDPSRTRFPVAAAAMALGLAVAACGSGDSAADDGAGPTPVAATVTVPAVEVPTLIIESTEVDPRTLVAPGVVVDAPTGPCTATVADVDDVDRVLVGARPGSVLCLDGSHPGKVLRIDRSGRPGAPLVVAGPGVEVGAIEIEADHVTVVGLVVTGADDGSHRPGVRITGRNVVVDELAVLEPGGDGIVCGSNDDVCEEVTIADSLISGVDGTGVMVFGSEAVVTGNEITGSRRVAASDADGVRFFGSRHRIVGNLIHTIHDRGYPGEGPHTDCFQTFDNSKPPTVDVIIEGNVCVDVDHQCLIASAEESAGAGAIGRSGGLVFRNNVCASNGSQAVFLREFPRSVIANNLFVDTNEFQTLALEMFSSDLRVVNNIFLGDVEPYLVDEGSIIGTVIDHNLHRVGGSTVIDEPNAITGVDPGFSFGSTVPLRPAADSPLVDAGLDPGDGALGLTDLAGQARSVDGDGDAGPRPDIGPVERP